MRMIWRVKVTLGALVFSGSITLAAERTIMDADELSVMVSGEAWCGRSVQVSIRSEDPDTHYSDNLVEVQRLLGALRAVMSFECPEAEAIAFTAADTDGVAILEGEISKADGWRLTEVWEVEAPAQVAESPQDEPELAIEEVVIRRRDDGPEIAEAQTEASVPDADLRATTETTAEAGTETGAGSLDAGPTTGHSPVVLEGQAVEPEDQAPAAPPLRRALLESLWASSDPDFGTPEGKYIGEWRSEATCSQWASTRPRVVLSVYREHEGRLNAVLDVSRLYSNGRLAGREVLDVEGYEIESANQVGFSSRQDLTVSREGRGSRRDYTFVVNADGSLSSNINNCDLSMFREGADFPRAREALHLWNFSNDLLERDLANPIRGTVIGRMDGPGFSVPSCEELARFGTRYPQGDRLRIGGFDLYRHLNDEDHVSTFGVNALDITDEQKREIAKAVDDCRKADRENQDLAHTYRLIPGRGFWSVASSIGGAEASISSLVSRHILDGYVSIEGVYERFRDVVDPENYRAFLSRSYDAGRLTSDHRSELLARFQETHDFLADVYAETLASDADTEFEAKIEAVEKLGEIRAGEATVRLEEILARARTELRNAADQLILDGVEQVRSLPRDSQGLEQAVQLLESMEQAGRHASPESTSSLEAAVDDLRTGVSELNRQAAAEAVALVRAGGFARLQAATAVFMDRGDGTEGEPAEEWQRSLDEALLEWSLANDEEAARQVTEDEEVWAVAERVLLSAASDTEGAPRLREAVLRGHLDRIVAEISATTGVDLLIPPQADDAMPGSMAAIWAEIIRAEGGSAGAGPYFEAALESLIADEVAALAKVTSDNADGLYVYVEGDLLQRGQPAVSQEVRALTDASRPPHWPAQMASQHRFGNRGQAVTAAARGRPFAFAGPAADYDGLGHPEADSSLREAASRAAVKLATTLSAAVREKLADQGRWEQFDRQDFRSRFNDWVESLQLATGQGAEADGIEARAILADTFEQLSNAIRSRLCDASAEHAGLSSRDRRRQIMSVRGQAESLASLACRAEASGARILRYSSPGLIGSEHQLQFETSDGDVLTAVLVEAEIRPGERMLVGKSLGDAVSSRDISAAEWRSQVEDILSGFARNERLDSLTRRLD